MTLVYRYKLVHCAALLVLAACSNTSKRPTDSTSVNLPNYLRAQNIEFSRNGNNVRITSKKRTAIQGKTDGLKLIVSCLLLSDLTKATANTIQKTVVEKSVAKLLVKNNALEFTLSFSPCYAIILYLEGTKIHLKKEQPVAAIAFEQISNQFLELIAEFLGAGGAERHKNSSKASIELTQKKRFRTPTAVKKVSLAFDGTLGLFVYLTEIVSYFTFDKTKTSNSIPITDSGLNFAATTRVITYRNQPIDGTGKTSQNDAVQFHYVLRTNNPETFDNPNRKIGNQHDVLRGSKEEFMVALGGGEKIIIVTPAASGTGFNTLTLNNTNNSLETTDVIFNLPDSYIAFMDQDKSDLTVWSDQSEEHCNFDTTAFEPDSVRFGIKGEDGKFPSLVAQGDKTQIHAAVVVDDGCKNKVLAIGSKGSSYFYKGNALFAGYGGDKNIHTVLYSGASFGNTEEVLGSLGAKHVHLSYYKEKVLLFFIRDNTVYLTQLNNTWSLPIPLKRFSSTVKFFEVATPYAVVVTSKESDTTEIFFYEFKSLLN